MDWKENPPDGNTVFQIEIAGQLHEKWSLWLNGGIIKIKESVDNTLITIVVPDQAALRGVLNKLWDLNLTITSVIQQNIQPKQGGCHED